MNNKSNSLFWPSYVDLMINLFFIMLVLFVLSFVLYKRDKDKMEELVIEAKKAREIKTTITQLMNNKDIFKYESEYKRYKLNIDVEFRIQKHKITHNDLKNYVPTKRKLLTAGKQIKNLIDDLIQKAEIDKNFENISYMLNISGMSSKDNYELNYELSYQRALSLYRFWKRNGIDLQNDRYKKIIDLQISGVGTGGIGRYKDEHKNKGFFIQILPKVGRL